MKRHTEFQIKCRKCGEIYKCDKDLNDPISEKHKNSNQLNCMSCDFQTNQHNLLKSHINFKHTEKQNREVFDCYMCEMQFMSIWILGNHKRDIHGPQEDCFFFSQNRCKFGKSCWKKHIHNKNEDLFICFSCKLKFKTINELMEHRKKDHLEICKLCLPKEGSCRFENNPDRCWFVHQDFQKGGEKQAPPLGSQSN